MFGGGGGYGLRRTRPVITVVIVEIGYGFLLSSYRRSSDRVTVYSASKTNRTFPGIYTNIINCKSVVDIGVDTFNNDLQDNR
mgnify:CR=1 FL=1